MHVGLTLEDQPRYEFYFAYKHNYISLWVGEPMASTTKTLKVVICE